MPTTFPTFAALALSSFVLTGCLNLKRVTDPTRFYVLSALSAGTPATAGSPGDLAVGLGQVNIPAYLLDRRIVVRHGTNEIDYSEYHRWAERLDKGLQRVLGANLSALLPTDRMVLSAWQRGEVRAEVYLAVERFEFDDRGRIILDVHWRITSPGGEKTWHADHYHITRQGPAFRVDPVGAVGMLSQALADLSRQIAAAVQSVSTRQRESKPAPSP